MESTGGTRSDIVTPKGNGCVENPPSESPQETTSCKTMTQPNKQNSISTPPPPPPPPPKSCDPDSTTQNEVPLGTEEEKAGVAAPGLEKTAQMTPSVPPSETPLSCTSASHSDPDSLMSTSSTSPSTQPPIFEPPRSPVLSEASIFKKSPSSAVSQSTSSLACTNSTSPVNPTTSVTSSSTSFASSSLAASLFKKSPAPHSTSASLPDSSTSPPDSSTSPPDSSASPPDSSASHPNSVDSPSSASSVSSSNTSAASTTLPVSPTNSASSSSSSDPIDQTLPDLRSNTPNSLNLDEFSAPELLSTANSSASTDTFDEKSPLSDLDTNPFESAGETPTLDTSPATQLLNVKPEQQTASDFLSLQFATKYAADLHNPKSALRWLVTADPESDLLVPVGYRTPVQSEGRGQGGYTYSFEQCNLVREDRDVKRRAYHIWQAPEEGLVPVIQDALKKHMRNLGVHWDDPEEAVPSISLPASHVKCQEESGGDMHMIAKLELEVIPQPTFAKWKQELLSEFLEEVFEEDGTSLNLEEKMAGMDIWVVAYTSTFSEIVSCGAYLHDKNAMYFLATKKSLRRRGYAQMVIRKLAVAVMHTFANAQEMSALVLEPRDSLIYKFFEDLPTWTRSDSVQVEDGESHTRDATRFVMKLQRTNNWRQTLTVGCKVDVYDQNDWWNGTVSEEKDDEVFICFDGFESTWNFWAKRTSKRLAFPNSKCWKFSLGWDSQGYDLQRFPNHSVAQLKRKCLDIGAVAFNSKGWLKSKVQSQAHWKDIEAPSEDEGLWVNGAALKRLGPVWNISGWKSWSEEDVISYLEATTTCAFSYRAKFRSSAIDGKMLPEVRDSDLKHDLSMENIEHRREILSAIRGVVSQVSVEKTEHATEEKSSTVLKSHSQRSGRGGRSCHQCRSVKKEEVLTNCITCIKRFCERCLDKYYSGKPSFDEAIAWVCPVCQDICSCSQCKKRSRGSRMGTAQRQNLSTRSRKNTSSSTSSASPSTSSASPCTSSATPSTTSKHNPRRSARNSSKELPATDPECVKKYHTILTCHPKELSEKSAIAYIVKRPGTTFFEIPSSRRNPPIEYKTNGISGYAALLLELGFRRPDSDIRSHYWHRFDPEYVDLPALTAAYNQVAPENQTKRKLRSASKRSATSLQTSAASKTDGTKTRKSPKSAKKAKPNPPKDEVGERSTATTCDTLESVLSMNVDNLKAFVGHKEAELGATETRKRKMLVKIEGFKIEIQRKKQRISDVETEVSSVDTEKKKIKIIIEDAKAKIIELEQKTESESKTLAVPDPVKIPEEFKCPISRQLMKEPVLLADGHSYDKYNLIEWLKTKDTSPITKSQLPAKTFFPNFLLAKQISAFESKRGNCS